MSKIIVLEGVDGTGKSTVANLLRELLPGSVVLRTPGTRLPIIRDLVLNPEYDLSHKSRLFFFFGEMQDTVREIKKHKDKIVILDRFFLSTYIYQVLRHLSILTTAERDLVIQLFNTFMPTTDLTVILDAEAEVVQARTLCRRQEFSTPDVFESEYDQVWEHRRHMYQEAKHLAITPLLGDIQFISTDSRSAEEVAKMIYNQIQDIL